jgi:hypothetical protein
MIGDLLHRLDLHGDVEPVDDVGRRFRQARGSRFRISAPSEITVTSPKPR